MRTSRIAFLVRYGLVGVFGIGVQVATLYVWVSVLGLERWYLAGVVLGYVLALLIGFAFQKYWTFRDASHAAVPRQLVLYTIVSLVNLGLATLLLASTKALFEHFHTDFFGFWYLPVQTGILFVVALASLALNVRVTFAQQPSSARSLDQDQGEDK